MLQVLDQFYTARINNVLCPWCGCAQPKESGEHRCHKCGDLFHAHEVLVHKYWTERVVDVKIKPQ